MKFLNRLSLKEKRWVFVTIFVAAGALVYSFWGEPGRKNPNYSNRKLQTKTAALKKSLKSLAGYEKIQARYELLSKEAPNLKTGEDATESLGLLEKMAGDCSVFIVSSKPQVLQEDTGPKHIAIDLTVRASAQNLAVFLYRLETSPHLLHVKRLTVSASSQNSSELEAAVLLNQLAIS